jgi:hypothetical protein
VLRLARADFPRDPRDEFPERRLLLTRHLCGEGEEWRGLRQRESGADDLPGAQHGTNGDGANQAANVAVNEDRRDDVGAIGGDRALYDHHGEEHQQHESHSWSEQRDEPRAVARRSARGQPYAEDHRRCRCRHAQRRIAHEDDMAEGVAGIGDGGAIIRVTTDVSECEETNTRISRRLYGGGEQALVMEAQALARHEAEDGDPEQDGKKSQRALHGRPPNVRRAIMRRFSAVRQLVLSRCCRVGGSRTPRPGRYEALRAAIATLRNDATRPPGA